MEEQKKKSKAPIIIVVIIAILAAVVLALYFGGVFAPKQQTGQTKLQKDVEAKLGMLPNKTPEEIQKLLDQVVAEGMFNISINAETVSDGKTANFCIENIAANNYLMQVDVVLDEDGTVVYSSGLIEPGYYIENVTLDKPMSKGKYSATAIFSAYNKETEEPEGTAAAQLMITVS